MDRHTYSSFLMNIVIQNRIRPMDPLTDPRYLMWCCYINDYATMDKNEKKRAKQSYAEGFGKKPGDFKLDSFQSMSLREYIFPKVNSLAPLECNQKEKETPMNTTANINVPVNIPNLDKDRQSYFLRRLEDISWRKRSEAPSFFGLEDDARPSNGEELVKRIKEGLYELIERPSAHIEYLDDTNEYLPALKFFRWRDPSKKRDKEGHETWVKAFEQASTNARDAIMSTDDGEKQLKAVQEFETIEVAPVKKSKH